MAASNCNISTPDGELRSIESRKLKPRLWQQSAFPADNLNQIERSFRLISQLLQFRPQGAAAFGKVPILGFSLTQFSALLWHTAAGKLEVYPCLNASSCA